jgi:two-component system response regulator FlrC
MANFILDRGDEVFAERVAEALSHRAVTWCNLCDEISPSARSDRFLILSSATESCDVNSNNFVHFLKANKISKAFVFIAGKDQFSIEHKLNGAIVLVSTPIDVQENSPLVEFYLALFLEQVLGKSINFPCGDPKSIDLVELLCRLAASNASVLINGPTGSGKEVVARLLHAKSTRSEQPFIAVNCAAIPENMLESMLFGHEKGAFTGAMHSNSGLFRAANFGTILLDEISEMPLALQSKLLRVLQEKVVTPVGSSKELRIDVRVLATTNRDMLEQIRVNAFREDLFYRLNVFPIAALSLKDRRLDIPMIAAHLLTRNVVDKIAPKVLDSKALDRLLQHDWPGNVREMDNVIQRAEILSCSDKIEQHNIIFDNELVQNTRNTMDALSPKLEARVG